MTHIILATAGLVVLWAKFLSDNRFFRSKLWDLPFPFGKLVTCPFCLSYWVSLLLLLLLRADLPITVSDVLTSWMTAGFLSSALVLLHRLIDNAGHLLDHSLTQKHDHPLTSDSSIR